MAGLVTSILYRLVQEFFSGYPKSDVAAEHVVSGYSAGYSLLGQWSLALAEQRAGYSGPFAGLSMLGGSSYNRL